MGKGKKKITREEYLSEVPDLDDFVIVVTGGNSGVGFEAASIFVEKNATVVLACRNKSRAQHAVAELKERHPDGDVNYLLLDASKRASIENFIQEFTTKYEKLNILVNNAGVAKNPKNALLTDFGTDVTYTVNMIAPYLLSIGLLDHLERGFVQNRVVSRIVNVSSLAANFAKDIAYGKWNSQKVNWKKRYCEAKLGGILISKAFNRRCEEADKATITLVCHPGFARSRLAEQTAGRMLAKLGQSSFMGSLPTVMAATSQSVGAGGFVTPKKDVWGPPTLGKDHKHFLDMAKQEKLWEKLAEVTETGFPE